MSNKSLEAFYDRIRSDPELEALASSALGDGPEAIVVLGLLHGFEFTEEELVLAMSHRELLRDCELSDEDIDLVAGGVCNSFEYSREKNRAV
ncbi:Nif11-like leader peptide family RiPP precursor [Pleomorphomonas sp. JP5]|uniref:Nif11-like leader peptide family RiPP precursor n=1 Tax=Pleomorphomonas sp. JP5 TaxID=2942998 RepID=UPI0038621039